MNRVSIVVQSKNGPYPFYAKIHELTEVKNFHLDPVDFYEEWGKAIPNLPHHEIEIVRPGKKFFKQYHLHIHRPRITSKPFVCYPKRMETVEIATRIFRTWCLGSVATIVEEIDLNVICEKCNNDPQLMEKVLRTDHAIFVAE